MHQPRPRSWIVCARCEQQRRHPDPLAAPDGWTCTQNDELQYARCSEPREKLLPGEGAPWDTDSDEEERRQRVEEEERNSRRATVSSTLNKLLQAVAKHKWAYPFKRPVTDKEAPDYKDIVANVRAPARPRRRSTARPRPRERTRATAPAHRARDARAADGFHHA